MKNHNLVKLKSGEKTVVVPGFKKVKFSSPEVKVTGTREHTVTVRKRRQGKSVTTSRKVAASGEEYDGYAVEVYLKGKLIVSEIKALTMDREFIGKKWRQW
ncbi:MAG: hypothetical protein QNL33_11960 [Akkermansiaceae bacterium]